jgi:hypothetical protein
MISQVVNPMYPTPVAGDLVLCKEFKQISQAHVFCTLTQLYAYYKLDPSVTLIDPRSIQPFKGGESVGI